MTDLARCDKPVETASGIHFPCARESGHVGECSPGRCGLPVRHAGGTYECSSRRGHLPPCRTWVEEADDERAYDRIEPREESAWR